MKCNNDIREAARRNGVYLYEIADALGKSDPTFNRWLRKEMTEEMKNKAFAAIEKIVEQRKGEDDVN